MTEFAGIFEVLASDQSDARLASRKALVLSRDRIDARLGKFLAASKSPTEFDARYDLVAEDFAGIVRVAANEVGHDNPDSLVETLRAHYADKDHWIQDAVKKPGDLHKKLHVPEDENIPEEKIENAEKSGDKNLKEKAQFAENVKKGSTQKKGKKCAECKDKNHSSCVGGDCSCKKCSSNDDGDDSLEFAAKTADAVPLVPRTSAYQCECEHCGNRWKSHEQNPETCPQCGEMGEHETDEPEDTHDELGKQKGNKNGLFASVHTADEGNTGLSGPSPKMDKKRWTPKSVKPIDVPSERHPTVQKDVTEVMPKDNLTEPAHDMDEINALTTVEELPSGTGMDDAGFAGNNQDMAPHTKTFGDGGQTDPVKSESLEA